MTSRSFARSHRVFNEIVIPPAPACRGTGGIMGLRPTQGDDKTPRSSNHSLWNPCPSLSSREPVTFSIFSCFSIPNQLHSKPPTKPSSCLPRLAVGAKRFADRSQTEALWRGVEEPVLSVAEGTPTVFLLPMLLGDFQPPKPTPGGPATVSPWGREREPAAPSTFSVATQARFTLAPPATCTCMQRHQALCQ